MKIGDVLGSIEEVTAPAAEPPRLPNKPLEPIAAPEPPANMPKKKSRGAATPVAKRIANDQQVDLAQVPPGRPGGRVTKTDVQRYLEAQHQPPTQTPAPRAPVVPHSLPNLPMPHSGQMAAPRRKNERIKMSRRRRTIAARLVEAQHTAAMLTTFNEIDMSAVQELRERRKIAFKERYGVSLGLYRRSSSRRPWARSNSSRA